MRGAARERRAEIETESPARLYALAAGAILTVLGVAGFFYGSSFATGQRAIRADLGEVLGILAVNGPSNLLHLATGLLALAFARVSPRTLSLGLGLAYLAIAVWGFLVMERGVGEVLGLFAVNTPANLLHLLLGLAGTAAGAASAQDAVRERGARPRRGPRRGRAATDSEDDPATRPPRPRRARPEQRPARAQRSRPSPSEDTPRSPRRRPPRPSASDGEEQA